MIYRNLFLLLQFFLLAVMIIPILPVFDVPWWLDNLLGLQWQWAFLAIFSGVIGLLCFRKITTWLLPIYLLLLLANFSGLYLQSDLVNESNTDFSIAQLNLRYNNPNAATIFSDLLEADHDLLVIQEVSDQQAGLLQSLRERYPHAMGSWSVSSHSAGHVLLSKWPLQKRRIHDLGYADGSIIDAEFIPGDHDQAVRILALHPSAPRNRALWQLRNSTFAFVARQLDNSRIPRQMVVGDLNATPWSMVFRQLLGDAGLSDSNNGHGYLPTWSRFNRIPVLRSLTSAYIDHCLVNSGLRVSDKQIRVVPGSDHRLVVTRVQLDR